MITALALFVGLLLGMALQSRRPARHGHQPLPRGEPPGRIPAPPRFASAARPPGEGPRETLRRHGIEL